MATPAGSKRYKYRGSFAQIIMLGPGDILHGIKNGETPIWTGPIMRGDAIDGDGKTSLTTRIGTIHFYWGTATQNPNPLLQTLALDQGNGLQIVPMPAYRNLIYAVGENLAFGQQTTPPTLEFEISKFPALLPLDGRVTRLRVTAAGSGFTSAPAVSFTGGGGGTGAAATATVVAGKITGFTMTAGGTGYTAAPAVVLTGGGGSGAAAQAYMFHELDGDCLLPEFIYEALTNTFWGAGRATSEINTASFIAACNQLILEDIGASPNFDDLLSAREMIGKLLPYMDAVIFFKEGQIHLKLIRRGDWSGVPILTEADFTDEPKPKNDGFENTQNFFRLTFTDRENEYEQASEPYDNPANIDIQGQQVDSQIDLPFVSRREVAKALVKRIGLKRSKPAFFWRARLQPTHNDKHPGDVVKVTYAKLGLSNKVCRIMEIDRGHAGDPEIEAVMMEEHTRETAFDYVAPEDYFFTSPSVDDTGTAGFAVVSVTPRLQALPLGLKGSSLDGFLVAFNRSSLFLTSAHIHWTWDEVQKEYQQLGFMENFPHYAEVVSWHQLSPTNWFFRLRFPSADFRDSFAEAAPTSPEWIYAAGHRKVRLGGTPSDTHELAGIWGSKVESGYFEAVDTALHDIEVTSGLYSSAALALETIALPANAPARHIYFGAREDFFVFLSDTINFERSGGNAPINPQTGISADTDWKRLVKVPAATHKNAEELSDVAAANFDRNDTTMNAGGTYTPDWGERALSTYELFDLAAGQYLLLSTAAAYVHVDDVDDSLGKIYEAAGSATERLLWNPVDDVLGAYLGLGRGIYSAAP